MTPGQKKLAAAGAVAISLGIGIAVLKKPAPQSLTAPYWYQSLGVGIPCPITPPGPNPYLWWTNPVDAKIHYFRFDGATRPKTGMVDGHYSGQGGADHTTMYTQGGRELPIASGAMCNAKAEFVGYRDELLGVSPDVEPQGLVTVKLAGALTATTLYPCTIFPAPPVDVPLEHPGGDITLCDKYRTLNGPAAKTCPSGVTDAVYSGQIKGMSQWSQPYNTVIKPQMDPQCAIVVTPTPVNTAIPVPTFTKLPVSTPIPTTPTPSPYADWIEQLSAEGITAGCGPGVYCPTAPVTREQLAVFLLRVKHGSDYVPPKCAGIFTDVPCK